MKIIMTKKTARRDYREKKSSTGRVYIQRTSEDFRSLETLN